MGVAKGDLQISGYQDRLHDPFYVGADKAFIGAAYNWSGLGRIPDPAMGGVNWKSVAMISDNYFITAFHNRPIRGNDPSGPAPKVRFYRTTDPSGEFWESEIAFSAGNYLGQRIGQTDLWVGKLATTPPDWVMRYPLAKRHEATNYLSYTDNDLFIFGQDTPRGYTGVRVGRNEVDQIDIGGNLTWDHDNKGGLGADEATTQIGDSGAPSFFVTATGTPVLAGIHTRENFDTGISANLGELLAAIGEPVSLSTGLTGDFNGDFHVDFVDFGSLAANYGKSGVRMYQGDANADGRADFFDYVAMLSKYGDRLYAPADFNRDGRVDGFDLSVISDNWMKQGARPFAMGDANGDGIVNLSDVEVFDANQFRASFGPLPAPLSPIEGDLTGNGVVDGFDLSVVTQNLNKVVTPGTSGDVDNNGVVNAIDLAFVSTRLGSSFGDLNGDHEVGSLDFAVVAGNWYKPVSGGRLAGDLNGDGWVTHGDAHILFQWWGQENGEFSTMLVPEPTGCGAFVVACLALAFPRRNRTRK